ncbi:MAG TPA: DUF192 domain-containing protein [Chloroflexia bacterium]|nr:DUF192 domain-containing protein [Chloroflexia bacterium]
METATQQPTVVPPAATSVPPSSTGAVEAVSTWVPPTALAGTPIPGAEATLTAAPRLKTGTLTITNSRGEQINMTVEIADTPETRQLGLMFRSSMPADAGMLFDFGEVTDGGFWMQNTILPLSIAFIAADGKIVDIKDMQPLNTTTVGSSGPYRYALETNQGFFRAHNIAPGDPVTLPGAQSAAIIPGMPSCPGEPAPGD